MSTAGIVVCVYCWFRWCK